VLVLYSSCMPYAHVASSSNCFLREQVVCIWKSTQWGFMRSIHHEHFVCVQSPFNNSSKSAHHDSIHLPAMHAANSNSSICAAMKVAGGLQGQTWILCRCLGPYQRRCHCQQELTYCLICFVSACIATGRGVLSGACTRPAVCQPRLTELRYAVVCTLL